MLPPHWKGKLTYPIIYGPRVYILSSQNARKNFIANPEYYLNSETPGPFVPIRAAVVGPPKSGKSTGMTIVSHVHVHVHVCTLYAYLIHDASHSEEVGHGHTVTVL